MKMIPNIRNAKFRNAAVTVAIIAVAAVSTMVVPALAQTARTGSFTDPRDGQTYRTVVMPDGKTWMAQNLNYRNPKWVKNDINGDVAVGDKGSWCYNNSADSCKKYGRLYTWNAAIEACPAGWRLPSNDDWTALVNAVGDSSTAGRKLKSQNGWTDNGNGTDDFGFSALPGGYRYQDGEFNGPGYYGDWWTATESGAERAWSLDMNSEYKGVRSHPHSPTSKSFGDSVRCVRDD